LVASRIGAVDIDGCAQLDHAKPGREGRDQKLLELGIMDSYDRGTPENEAKSVK